MKMKTRTVASQVGPRARDLRNTAFVTNGHQWAPVALVVDQLDAKHIGNSRHALIPMGRRKALRVAWALALAALTGRVRSTDEINAVAIGSEA